MEGGNPDDTLTLDFVLLLNHTWLCVYCCTICYFCSLSLVETRDAVSVSLSRDRVWGIHEIKGWQLKNGKGG